MAMWDVSVAFFPGLRVFGASLYMCLHICYTLHVSPVGIFMCLPRRFYSFSRVPSGKNPTAALCAGWLAICNHKAVVILSCGQ